MIGYTSNAERNTQCQVRTTMGGALLRTPKHKTVRSVSSFGGLKGCTATAMAMAKGKDTVVIVKGGSVGRFITDPLSEGSLSSNESTPKKPKPGSLGGGDNANPHKGSRSDKRTTRMSRARLFWCGQPRYGLAMLHLLMLTPCRRAASLEGGEV